MKKAKTGSPNIGKGKAMGIRVYTAPPAARQPAHRCQALKVMLLAGPNSTA